MYWNPANTATGIYTLKGTFTLMRPSGHVNYYGLVFGASDLDGPQQKYSYFVVAQNGTWLVKRRDGSSTSDLAGRMPNEAVKKIDASGKSTNALEVRVGADKIDFAVNGAVVHSMPKSGLGTDGIYGIRINHLLEVTLTGLGCRSSGWGRCCHGWIVASLPFMAPYTSSKFAMEGWSDSLRLELQPDGIQVAIVEPGAIATPMWAKGKDEGQRLSEQLRAHLQQRYAGPMESLQAASTRSAKAAIPPEKVARAILQALTVRRPRTRYIVGTDAHAQALMHWLLPDRAMDSVLRAALGLRKQRAR